MGLRPRAALRAARGAPPQFTQNLTSLLKSDKAILFNQSFLEPTDNPHERDKIYPHSIVTEMSKSVCLLPRGRVLLIKAYTARLHPKFRLQVYEKVLLVEAHKRVGKSSISVWKKVQMG